MSTARDTWTRINNSPQMKMVNISVTVAMLGVLGRRFQKNPTVWTALPLVRTGITLAECFKPATTTTPDVQE